MLSVLRLHSHTVSLGVGRRVEVEAQMPEYLLWVVFHRAVLFAHPEIVGLEDKTQTFRYFKKKNYV